MSNPIPHSSLFVTPNSVAHLDELIRQLPATEHAIIYQYVMYAFNLAYKIIEDAKDQ